ncbi:MAG: hypothetical protein JOZ34_06940, partial [Gammaproteobacteria bacterium]|nr:hypothetical protein [Gammaproteobacteria bacterium]
MSWRHIGMQMCLLALSHAALAGQPASPAQASSTPPWMNDVDGFVLAEMQRQKVPGVAVGVQSKGDVAAAKGYGDSNVELAGPVSA